MKLQRYELAGTYDDDVRPRDVLLAELSQLNRMIADAPPSSYIDCLHLQSRRREVEAELSALRGRQNEPANDGGWITDRLPTEEDGSNGQLVYDYRGEITIYYNIRVGEAWKPIPKCEPYVKPKRYYVDYTNGTWNVWRSKNPLQLVDTNVSTHIPTREAAERIAAIYEEVQP